MTGRAARAYGKSEIDTIFELRRQGKTYREIAEVIDRTPKAIEVFYNSHKARTSTAPMQPRVRVRRDRVSSSETPPANSCAFTLTPPLEVVEQAGGVDRFVAEVVSRVPVPGWRVRVARGDDAQHHALITARAAAASRGAEIVVFDRERSIVAERPSHAWDRTPEELRGDAYVVIPIVFERA
jgi:hypothetical protein